MAVDATILNYTRYLAASPVSMQSVREAVAEAAPHFHISRVTVDISEAHTVMPSSTSRFHTLFEDPAALTDGEPLEFRYSVDVEGDILISLYPGGASWGDEDRIMLELFVDITFFYFGRIRFDAVVKKSSMTQFLTGLPNSAGYIALCTQIMKEGRLPQYNAYYFNLKGFGAVSRRFGVREGDAVIKRYAVKVRDGMEADDVLGHLGGDNFVALVKKERADQFLKLISDVTVYAVRNDIEVEVHISSRVGALEIKSDFSTVGEVIGLPAVALGVARAVAHKPVVYVNDEMIKRVNWQKQIEHMFIPALREEEFQVYYQPKVDSRMHELAGAEALVRWMHKGEMISPGDFIPALERESLIVQLDLYVLRHVCADIRRWEEQGIEPVQVSVNFSRRDLVDPGLALQIDEIIRTFGVDPSLIQVEVTETVDEQEHGMLTDFLNALWDMHISTAIDDFGSGYSSLSTLRSFKVNVLKIDRSFINNEVLSERDEFILRDVIHMARMLGINVVTEGVEREDQLRFVNKVGCYMIQGFYYDRPLPLEQFEERLKKRFYHPEYH